MSQEVVASSISQTVHVPVLDAERTTSRLAVFSRAGAGAFLGLAWAAALRAWMVMLALGFGEQPQFTWRGTFGGILLPAALMGAWLGAAAGAAENSRRKRWALLSPLLLVIGPALATDNFISILVTTGMGGGAIAVALIGLLGGYGFSGVGAKRPRRVCGFLAVALTLAAGIGSFFPGGGSDTSSSAGRAFSGLLFALLLALLITGVSAPFRTGAKR